MSDYDREIDRTIDENKASDVTVSPSWDKARKIIAEHLLPDDQADKVIPTANFMDDLGADSLDLVELVMAFKEDFNIEISDLDAEGIETVADAVRLIDTKRTT